MNFGEVKQKILGLGFEEEQSYTDNAQKFIDAINRAVKIISQSVKPVLKSYDIVMVSSTGFTKYDMAELTKTDRTIFDSVKRVSFVADDEYYSNIPYKIENESTLVLKNDTSGTATVWFAIRPKEVTVTSLDAEEIEINYSVEQLLPLLASYYIWLDDDERKAITYRNDYDDLKTQIAGKQEAKIEIVGGF